MELTAAIETRLIRAPKLPLRNWDQVEEMVGSIKEQGLIQPIVVRFAEDHFEVVAGSTRFLACKKLRWKSIPCLVRELSDAEAFEISLVENIQRKAMNPIEEAQAFEKYIENNGRGSESRLAKVIGKSQEYISHRLSLLQLSESVQEEVIRGRIKPSTAQEIASLKDEELQRNLSRQITEMNLRANEVRHTVRSIKEKMSVSSNLTRERNHENSVATDELSETDFDKELRSDLSFMNSDDARVLLKAITAVRVALVKLGSLIDEQPTEIQTREILAQKRLELHDVLDSLIKSKLKLKDTFENYASEDNLVRA